ncbi:MAG TPA: LysE family translocator [Actinomycetospora sp.]|uniref:LysE family translocator n=1 Tax=Actinomycetospora sp. TaxID=1872135 RepID=UPI002F4285A8
MTPTAYGTFAVFALLLALAPGPDFAVVVKNALVGGRRAGFWTGVGITASNVVQGTAAAVGVGALIVASQPVFEGIRWAGVAYLCWLAVHALHSAWRGPEDAPGDAPAPSGRARAVVRLRQGFLSNITNPKVLVFYLSVLPQFLHPGSAVTDALALAYTHAVLGLIWLTVLVVALHSVRGWLARRRVRRSLDAVTGAVLLGLAGKLAAEA